MSCDHRRAVFFSTRVGPALETAFGSEAATHEALELIYDVVSSLPPPADPAEQRQIAASTLAIFAQAEREGLKLYPHPSKSGLPKPDAQHAWSVVAATLSAVEQGTPLPPLAEDARQSICHRRAVESPDALWQAPMSGPMRWALRRAWAANPELVAAIVDEPRLVGSPEYAGFLASVSQSLAESRQVPGHLAAAARHYLALHEQEALDAKDRVQWAQVLAAVAGVGIKRSRRMGEGLGVCSRCGHILGRTFHHCLTADARMAPAVASAVAQVLGEGAHLATATSGSPVETAETLLDDWMRQGSPLQPSGTLGKLARVMREADVRAAQEMSAEEGEPTRSLMLRLRDATLRTPVMFDGAPHVWEDGKLYRADDFRARSAWERRRHGEWSVMLEGVSPVATISAGAMARLIAGEPLKPDEAQFFFSTVEQAKRHHIRPTRVSQTRTGDLLMLRCGCVFRCIREATKQDDGDLQRLHHASGCSHGSFIPLLKSHRGTVPVVDLSRPRFDLPAWRLPVEETPDVV